MPIVDGIDNMQLLYGVAGSAATPDSITRYVDRDQLTPDDWTNIRAIRIGLLVSNGLTTGKADAMSRTYNVLDSDAITFNATDRQLRRIYSTTIQFNNRN